MLNDKQVIDMFKQMLRLDTTNPPGNEQRMTDYLSDILTREGIWHQVLQSGEGRANLIARIGEKTKKRPIVLISHTDVVPCEGQPWKHPPFDAVEENGMIYGRGTVDTKGLTAMQLAAFINLKDVSLARPVYLLATADEEAGSTFGMPRVVDSFTDELSDSLVINEGGGFAIEHAGERYYLCTVGEKGRIELKVSITGDTGPASFKSDRKAVDTFVALIKKLSSHRFPGVETEVSKRFTEVLGDHVSHPFLKNFAWYNSHDAIILQRYDIGTQVNVLPYLIEFELSVQLLPGRTEQEARNLVDALFAGTGAQIEVLRFDSGFESDCSSTFYRTMEHLARTYYDARHLIPVYALGRTDGRFLGPIGAQVYGFSPVTEALPFEEILKLVHQVDERIDRESIVTGARFLTDLIHTMGSEHEEG